MKRQTEGTAAQHYYIVDAHQLIKSVHSSRYSIDDYIATHQRSHNELERFRHPVREEQQVINFMASITHPTLNVANKRFSVICTS
jgi:hypothetical protein